MSPLLECADEVGGRLGGHEGSPRQPCREQTVVLVEHRQSRVLQGGDPGRLEQLVEIGAHDKLEAFDRQQQALVLATLGTVSAVAIAMPDAPEEKH